MDGVPIVVVLTNFTADSKSLSQLKLPIQQDSSVFGLLTPTAALFSACLYWRDFTGCWALPMTPSWRALAPKPDCKHKPSQTRGCGLLPSGAYPLFTSAVSVRPCTVPGNSGPRHGACTGTASRPRGCRGSTGRPL